jgi:uncharacterized protein
MSSHTPEGLGPIIDVDVHHTWNMPEDVVRYLPEEWRDYVHGSSGDDTLPIDAIGVLYPHFRGTNKRLDAYSEEGHKPGSHYETLRDQHLDPHGVERCVLTYDVGQIGVANPYYHHALAAAANDWTVGEWLSIGDDRLYGALIVPTHMPDRGAEEIRRAGSHPGMVEALLVTNGVGLGFGHPVYAPIHAAAAEMGLPLAMHPGGDQWVLTTHAAAGGIPPSRFEFHVLSPQANIFHIASFITHGVFERHPDLKLLVVENGISWIPQFLWALDAQFETLRRELPITRLPSEVFREHVRISTQPLELTHPPSALIESLEAVGGLEDVLVFSSDYPHWDTDDPMYAARKFPREWWPKIFYENALALCRWPSEVVA